MSDKTRSQLIASTVGSVKRYTLINPVDATTKRFGFRCPVCDLTYQDNLKLLDHFNSYQHKAKAGITTAASTEGEVEPGVPRASFATVVETMEQLIAERVNSRDPKYEERERQRRQVINEQRKQRRKLKRTHGDTEASAEVEAALGFGSFGKRRK
ncbi:hypothetical protein DIURU_005274 [Diutina rugosa]|uniref:C2H2-type domain-containing protein n=1 Tax=Diutina rugosa TaxID=5481 RepID=A0A642UGD2_DIURU|nr:uncharacterized protein DIURU_005274 [Diutina rugosa]KAA8897297.1 hypothetical protein DIURU_005274 [Diutina rugosa]